MGAGVDTVFAPVVPTAQPFGVALKISFGTTEEPGEQHQLTVSFIGPDKRLLDASAVFTISRPINLARTAGQVSSTWCQIRMTLLTLGSPRSLPTWVRATVYGPRRPSLPLL